MNDFHPDHDWHAPAPSRALIVCGSLSACVVMLAIAGLAYALGWVGTN